jgi:hypothetical protein
MFSMLMKLARGVTIFHNDLFRRCRGEGYAILNACVWSRHGYGGQIGDVRLGGEVEPSNRARA